MKFALLSTLVLAFTVPSVLGVTLYRNGGATKPYNQVRTPQDYDNPVKGIVPANPNKGMSLNSNKAALPGQTKIWKIDSADITTSNLKPVNDKGTHWSLTLTKPTQIDQLLNDINNAKGWSKIS